MSYSSTRTAVRTGIVTACLLAIAWSQAGTITPVAGGFLLTGTQHRIVISSTNGSLVSLSAPGGAPIASGGEAGLWHLAIDVDGSGSKTGYLNAAMFSPSPSPNTFSWSLPAPSNVLHLVYSNAAVTVHVSASNHTDGVDLAARVTPHTTNVLSLTLPGPLRFDPASVERFVAPNHSSDGVGMAYHANFFAPQPEQDPASWKTAIVGPGGYITLYGAPLTFGTNNTPVPLSFTTNGTAWLGSAVTGTWSSASAIVNRPPAPGQADVVLINSPEGAFLSGSKLGGGASAGYLMRIGGPIRASEVDLSLDVVAGALEHLSGQTGGRSIIALLSLVRGPVVGANWPSEVRLDQWRTRLAASGVLASNGLSYIELANLPDIVAALNNTNVFAILNPYGELIPASLSGGVNATVTNIGNFVRNGGHWFEVAGYPFFQTLQPELYYTNNIFYPPAFADFLHLATTNGQAAVYGVQPLSTDPWAGATNPAALFVPGRLVWGADTAGGWLQRAFGTFVTPATTWTSPSVRIAIGHSPETALADYRTANQLNRNLEAKMDAPTLDAFRQGIMIHLKGGATQMTARLDDLPAPALLHFEEYLFGGFDKQYPDHLPPNPSFGTVAEFTNFLAQARARNQLTMPYTNPTFWGVDPKGPTFLATNDAPLLLNLDGSINLEEYFGEAGFTVTPWHPAVQAANRHTRNEFLTNYPVDVIFHDQIGARTWQYDLNPESPTPFAYMAGIAAIAAEDSQFIPTSTENGWDRLINHNAQFAGLAWGLAPTTNAPFWRRYLRDRYNPDTWEIFPLAQHLAHDKVSFIYNNLSAPVHSHEVMAWTLGLGYGMTYVVETEQLDNPALLAWLGWIDRVQKSIAARYVGEGIASFTHRWGTNTAAFDNGFIAATYGPVSVLANLGPDPVTTNTWSLPGYGYAATAPGLTAGYLVPAGATTPDAFVCESNTATSVSFWIHSTGGRTARLTLPPGFTGEASVQLGTNSAFTTTPTNHVLAITLPASTNPALWSGTATFGTTPARQFLVDFGRHDAGTNGLPVTNPDPNGNHWNNLGPVTTTVTNGLNLANLVDTANQPSSLALVITSTTWQANGILNGGLLTPSPTLLGELAVTNATMDYFFTTTAAGFKLTGLDTSRTYALTFFGTRDTTVTRISTYTSGTNTVNLTTSGTGIGAGGANQNNNTSATLNAIAPSPAGEIPVTVSVNTGGFAYLGILRITESAGTPAPPPAATTQALYRIDLGRHDGGVNGTATTNPDANGAYWNNFGPTTEAVPNGTSITNLVNTTNGPSTLGLSVITANWKCNGKLNGGLLAPSPALLGNLAIASATEDYFFTQGSDTFRLAGLNPALRYNLRFFGTRETTSTRITTYASGFASTNLQTSGTAIGAGGYNGNNNTLAALNALAPDPSGRIDVTVSVNTGGFAYLGILEIEAYTPAASTSPSPAIALSPASLTFITTNGAAPPPAAVFSVTNSGSGTLTFSAATNAAWLSVSPNSGSLAAGAGQALTVTVNPAGLPLGISTALIAITDPAATNSPQTVSVSVQVKSADPLLAVFGSSVAKGWNSSGQFADPDVFEQGGSWSNGYAALMTRLLAAQGGPVVTNVSTPGDNTAAGLSKFGTYVLPLAPDYALIAYSLGNEGLSSSASEAQSSNIVATFTANLLALIDLCRTNGIHPVVSSVYPHGNYTTNHYAHLKRMHLTINSWNVPSLNLLTPIDDGTGQWIDGYWSDAAHPNDAGYAEFFYSFVPSLFDALAAGKTNAPAPGSSSNFARLTGTPANPTPLVFTPSNTVHGFTTAFRFRTTTTGTLAAVRSGSDYATLELRTGHLVYVARSGTETVIITNLADGTWHDIALSGRYALSNTAVYINGLLAASIPEQFAPDQFILGGPGSSGRAATPASIDLDAWCVYRAGWTPDEALAHAMGNLQQSSMEIGAMLDDTAFTNGTPVANAAQSLSTALVNTTSLQPRTPADDQSTLLIFGSSVAQGYHGPGSPGYTNGSFALGYGGRLTPLLEQTGWLVTNRSVGGNTTTLLNDRFDADAVPVNPDVILIGLSLGNEGLVFNPDAEIPFESFRSGMTNLIHRSRTNGFYPVVTLTYPHALYDATKYAYLKRMNLVMNTWDVPGVNFLGAVDNGAGQWADGHFADDAHPNPTGYQEMFAAFVPSLFDAITLGKTNRPSLDGTPGFARVTNGGPAPLTFTPDRTVRGFTTAFRVRATETGTVAAALSSTGSAVVASPATFLIDFGRHDGVNGNPTTSPDANGNYWNNLSPANPATNNSVNAGTTLANLVTISNVATSAGVLIPTVGWQANGIFNGGLLAPSNSLLGHLAIASATEDYFFIGGSAPITLTGLNPDSTYTLRFFGSRNTTETRTTIFAVRTNATALTTSGSGIGTYSTNQNDNTVAQLTGLVPDPDGNLEVLVIRAAGSFAHLNLMEVIETPGNAQPRGGRIELRDDEVAYVAANGSEITTPVDADRGAWIDIALSHSTARNRTLLYVDGVFAGDLAETMRPMQFVLGGPGPLTNTPPPPATLDLQDWCVYRAPWTPEEAMAQHTGALQHASMEIGAPLHDATFTTGTAAENRAQSLSLARITGTNLTAGTTLAAPGNLQAVTPAFNTVTLSWSDTSATEDGFVLERRLAGLGGPWSIRSVVPANTTTITEFSVAAATYEYRVSAQEGVRQGDYSGIATITVSDPPSASDSPITSLQFPGGQPSLAFIGSNAVLYTLQYTTNLLNPSAWQHVLTNGSPVLAIGNGTDLRTLTDTNLPETLRAYRLTTAPTP